MKYIVLFCLFIFVVSINMTATIQHLTDNALSKSSGNCAKYVANALEAGDFVFTRQNYAYQYWSNEILIGIGYYEINETSSYEKGEILLLLKTMMTIQKDILQCGMEQIGFLILFKKVNMSILAINLLFIIIDIMIQMMIWKMI